MQSEHVHQTKKGVKCVKVEFQSHKRFTIYKQRSGWNEQSIMMTELNTLNKEMCRQTRKICLVLDCAPCHLICNEPIPDLSNIKIVYIGRNMTDKLQSLDHNIIAVLKNKYKKWLNLESFKAEGNLSKFAKIKQMADILYSIRPAIGIYCWDNTIFKENNEPMVPEEIISSHIEAKGRV